MPISSADRSSTQPAFFAASHSPCQMNSGAAEQIAIHNEEISADTTPMRASGARNRGRVMVSRLTMPTA